MRLFIAIDLPKDIKDYLMKIEEKIDVKGLKLVKDIHLTLKFLGEVEDDKAEQIKNLLKEIKINPFEAKISGLGVFPSGSYIRVVWVGVQPEDKIIEIQKEIDERMKEIGFKKEKNFKAHITLARVKFLEDKEGFVSKLNEIKPEEKSFEVKSFKLIKSTLTREGPIYEDLAEF